MRIRHVNRENCGEGGNISGRFVSYIKNKRY